MRRISRFNRPACDSVRCPPIPSINADIPARSVVDFPDLSIRSNVGTNGGDHSISSLATLSRVWKLNELFSNGKYCAATRERDSGTGMGRLRGWVRPAEQVCRTPRQQTVLAAALRSTIAGLC